MATRSGGTWLGTVVAVLGLLLMPGAAAAGDDPILQDPPPSLSTDGRTGAGTPQLLKENSRVEKRIGDVASGKKDRQDPLTPAPDPKLLGPAAIEVTSFHGVTPGVSTREEVEKAWGPPKEIRDQGKQSVHLHAVAPFAHVEASYVDKKVASIIIRFERGYPADSVAQQLDLSKLQPVLVSNELGQILGQAYPEHGVLFSFESPDATGKTQKKVTHIILEPITADPFVLRAETNMDTRPEFSLHDLDEALKMQPGNARAHWLRSRVLTSLGEFEKATAAAREAVRLEPKDPRFQVTRALTMAQAGHVAEAVAEAEKAVELAQSRPHIKARAICLLGDLKASTARPDFKAAFQYHMQAIQTADPLTASRHPAVRVAAKEVLVDAHLGAAHDIAWGEWREKERAVDNWLGKAKALAADLVKNESGGEEYSLRIGTRAMAACVGLQGRLDPTPWVKEAVRAGDSLIDATPEASRKSQLQWEVALTLYDALQVYQMRGESQEALKYGELAISYLEKSGRQKQSAAASYLLGRLCFRLGAVYAIRDGNHQRAIQWFDKAVPLLGKQPPPEALGSLGRLGETFVSMGVSYWETGRREKALALTQHGCDLIEEAVAQKACAGSALAIPYSNLASMHRQLGHIDKADRLEEMASKTKTTQVR